MRRSAHHLLLALLLLALSGTAQVVVCAPWHASKQSSAGTFAHSCCAGREHHDAQLPAEPCKSCVLALAVNAAPNSVPHYAHLDLTPCAFQFLAEPPVLRAATVSSTFDESLALGPPLDLFHSSCLLLI